MRARRHGRPRARSTAAVRRRLELAPGPAEPPPTLESLLELATGRIGLDLEIKEPRVVPELLTAIAGWPGAIVLTSFYPEAIRAVHQLDSTLRTGLLAGPMHIGDPVANAHACGADLLVCAERRATAKLLAAATLPLWVWTVNDRARLASWLSNPTVECVITDDPETAVEVRTELRRAGPGDDA